MYLILLLKHINLYQDFKSLIFNHIIFIELFLFLNLIFILIIINYQV